MKKSFNIMVTFAIIFGIVVSPTTINLDTGVIALQTPEFAVLQDVELMNKDNVPIKCNKNLLVALGFEVEDRADEKPKSARFAEIGFCRKNKETCCNAKELTKIARKHFNSLQKLQKIFEPFEEALTFVKGEKILETIIEEAKPQRMADMKCTKYSKGNVFVNKEINLYTDTDYMAEQMGTALLMLSEIPFNIKKQGWFFSDLICTACNPFDQEYIEFTDGLIKFTGSENTCIEIAELKEFQNRLETIYGDFLKPLADTFSCLFRKEQDQDFDEKELLPDLNWEQVIKDNKQLDDCHREFNQQSKCYELCDKSMTTFEISPILLKGYALALSGLFKGLGDMDVEDFYQDRKNTEYKPDTMESSVLFFEIKTEKETKMSMEIQAAGGIHIFSNHFAKKFEEFDKQFAKVE